MNRNHYIDILRGFAILSVILLHLDIHLPFTHHLFPWLFNVIFKSGYYGVIIFFVISGFLITESILKKWGALPTVHLRGFYQMRFARIMPCLLALVLLLSILDLTHVSGFVLKHTSLLRTIFAALTFHINWLQGQTGYLPGSWDMLWSLSVEEVFYFIFPLLCFSIKNRQGFILILLLLIIIGPFARTWGNNEIWQDHGYLSCMDGIAFGVLAALFVADKPPRLIKLFLFAGLGLFGLIFFFRHLVFLLGMTKLGLNITFLELGTALILIAVHSNRYQPKGTSLLCWYGRNSYEIYLTHGLLITGMAETIKNIHSTWMWYIAITVASGVLGSIIAKYYSEPLNQLIRKISFNKEPL